MWHWVMLAQIPIYCISCDISCDIEKSLSEDWGDKLIDLTGCFLCRHLWPSWLPGQCKGCRWCPQMERVRAGSWTCCHARISGLHCSGAADWLATVTFPTRWGYAFILIKRSKVCYQVTSSANIDIVAGDSSIAHFYYSCWLGSTWTTLYCLG